MLPEIWEPDLTVVFVGTAVDEASDSLGFHHLHPRDRFWGALELSGITPVQMISRPERKALDEGHAHGTLSDPIRSMFIQKKTSQLLRLGIGLTTLNRTVVPPNDKDKSAKPTEQDVQHFLDKALKLKSKILAFVTTPEIFVESLKSRYPDITIAIGLQAFKIGTSEVWLLGSTSASLRGEALSMQEDTLFALGERISALRRVEPKG